MGIKLDFDSATREFVCLGPSVGGVFEVDLLVDLYSDGKEDWQDDITYPDLAGMRFPVDAIGGNPFGDLTLGISYLISDGWSFRPLEEDHTFRIVGNIGTTAGWELVEDTVGAFRVRVENQVSALVEVRTDTATATAIATISEGVFGKKYLIDSDLSPATNPGFMVLFETDLTLIGYKEIFQEHTEAGDAAIIGYTRTGKGIGWEGPLVPGLLPP